MPVSSMIDKYIVVYLYNGLLTARRMKKLRVHTHDVTHKNIEWKKSDTKENIITNSIYSK